MTPEVRKSLIQEMRSDKALGRRHDLASSSWYDGRAAGIHLALVLDRPNEPCGDPGCEYSDCRRLMQQQEAAAGAGADGAVGPH